jgi:hypothetical protein
MGHTFKYLATRLPGGSKSPIALTICREECECSRRGSRKAFGGAHGDRELPSSKKWAGFNTLCPDHSTASVGFQEAEVNDAMVDFHDFARVSIR